MNYDETPIRTFTAYTFDQAKDFQRYHARRYRKGFLILLGVCVLAVAGALYAYFKLPVRDAAQLLTFLPGIGMITALTVIFHMFTKAGFYTQKQHERSMAGIEEGQLMLFRERDFLIAFSREELAKAEFIPYDRLIEIRETDDAFYLYANKQQAFIVTKNGFEEGSPIGLRGIFERAVPDKYTRDLSVKITSR